MILHWSAAPLLSPFTLQDYSVKQAVCASNPTGEDQRCHATCSVFRQTSMIQHEMHSTIRRRILAADLICAHACMGVHALCARGACMRARYYYCASVLGLICSALGLSLACQPTVPKCDAFATAAKVCLKGSFVKK